MLTQTVLHFLGQQEFLFVKLEEDLQVRKVALVLLFLQFAGVAFYEHGFFLVFLVFKDCLGGLHKLAVSLLLLNSYF